MGITNEKGKHLKIDFEKSWSGHNRNKYNLIIKKEDEFCNLVNEQQNHLQNRRKKIENIFR